MKREIEYFKSLNLEDPVPLDALKALEQLGSMFEEKVEAPEPFKTILETWNKFRLFAIAEIAQEEFPALTKCWKDLQTKFAKRFEDETILDTWSFFDFPCKNGKAYAHHFVTSEEKKREMFQIASFAEAMMNTRYGLYQLVMASKDTLKLKELFTGCVYEAHNTIDAHGDGEIFLVRLFPAGGKYMIFGDPFGFPREFESQLKSMVIEKALLYYGESEANETALYSKHMKLSGPYWMSVVCPDQSAGILDPDHYQYYLR